jgi:type VI secretion system secreted protein Hcp
MAATDYFLKLDGIEGESKDEKHQKEIDIQSFSWGETSGGTMSSGGGGARKIAMTDFHFTMAYNKASPQLMQVCATSRKIPTALLTVRKAGKDQQEYLKVTMNEVLVSSYQTDGHGGGDTIPTDQFSLNFAKIEFEYREQDESGQLKGAITARYDLKS